LAQVEEYGVDRLLDEVTCELRERRYRPQPTRTALIPKPGLKDQHRPCRFPAFVTGSSTPP
jgi:RNA-directed DNA polymerase